MSIPDFQTMMLPFLNILQDGQDHSLTEIKMVLAKTFALTEDERKETIPSGRQAKFDNRVGWARTYLKKAGLVEATARATFRLTECGTEVLKTNPKMINIKFLEQYPDFLAFHNSAAKSLSTPVQTPENEVLQTPEESLEVSYQKLRSGLAQELLEVIKTCSPQFFENLVLDLLLAMGYGGSHKDAGKAIGKAEMAGSTESLMKTSWVWM